MIMEKASYVKSYAMVVAREIIISNPADKKRREGIFTTLG